MRSLRKIVELAKKHHHIPEINSKTRYKGIVMSSSAWALFAIVTTLLEKISQSAGSEISTMAFSRIFFGFSLVHFAMFIIFFVCCLKKGVLNSAIPKS